MRSSGVYRGQPFRVLVNTCSDTQLLYEAQVLKILLPTLTGKAMVRRADTSAKSGQGRN
jgi:hypothetical protein